MSYSPIGKTFQQIVDDHIKKVCDPRYYDDITEGQQLADLEGRYRVYEFILYDDSLVDDWLSFLQGLHIQIYAIHHTHDTYSVDDPDLGHKAGEPKKPHWHVWLNWPGKKKGATVLEITARCGGVRLQNKHDAIGSCRYLTHMDEHGLKYAYPTSDVLVLGGSKSYMEYCMSSADSIQDIVQDMTAYILDNDVTMFPDFCEYCMKNNRIWYDVLTSKRTLFFITLIKSMGYKVREEIGSD